MADANTLVARLSRYAEAATLTGFVEMAGAMREARDTIEQLEKERAEAYHHMTEARAGHADAVRGLTCEYHGLYRGETTGCCIHHRAKSRERDDV